MKNLLLLIVVAALAACNSQTEKKVEETIDPKLLISCEGIGEVKLTDTYADLQKKFGDTALTEHENNIAGKFTTLWENNPEHINVYWKEAKAPYKTIRYLEIVDAMAPYMTKDSIGVGMPMKDLVKKNGGMALSFKNFSAKDDPGLLTGFNNGEIPTKIPCFAGTLEWTGQRPIDVNELREFQEQEEVKSFDRILQRYDIILSTLRINGKSE